MNTLRAATQQTLISSESNLERQRAAAKTSDSTVSEAILEVNELVAQLESYDQSKDDTDRAKGSIEIKVGSDELVAKFAKTANGVTLSKLESDAFGHQTALHAEVNGGQVSGQRIESKPSEDLEGTEWKTIDGTNTMSETELTGNDALVAFGKVFIELAKLPPIGEEIEVQREFDKVYSQLQDYDGSPIDENPAPNMVDVKLSYEHVQASFSSNGAIKSFDRLTSETDGYQVAVHAESSPGRLAGETIERDSSGKLTGSRWATDIGQPVSNETSLTAFELQTGFAKIYISVANLGPV